MNKKLIIATLLTMFIIFKYMEKKLKPLVKKQRIRGKDAHGSGVFGASRGNRTHEGIDIITITNEDIYSPISGIVKRYAYPYANDLKYKGIIISNNDFEVKIFYINPVVLVGAKVEAGQFIGKAQNISSKYTPGMINHLHLEVRNANKQLLDPTNLF